MSSERTPILSGTIPAFELFMTAWEELGEKHPRLARWTKVGVEWAVKYYSKMDQTWAYVIAMCELNFYFFARENSYNNLAITVLNPSIRMSWIRKNWDLEYIEKAVNTIKTLVSSVKS